MGRLYEKPPHPSETRDFILQRYPFKHDERGHEFEWHVGDEERFTCKFRWITDDHIWWKEGYIKHPKSLPRIEVRKWVEKHLDGDTMVEEGRDSAKYYLDEIKEPWKFTHYNKYWVDFHFETEDDLTHFLIKWA